jgi:precorrin-6Y C5,15-methyltransferase (decarboxylating)
MSDLQAAAPWLTVVGIGEDGFKGLGQAARRAIRQAGIVFGSPRQLALLPVCFARDQERHTWGSPFSLQPVLDLRGTPVCVLASGDPMLFGVGASFAKQLDAQEIRVLPAPSSCSLAAARMGWALQDVVVISLLARSSSAINAHLQPAARLLILSNDGNSAAQICSQLTQKGFGSSRISVLEHLGAASERRIDTVANRWAEQDVAALNIVAIECVADADIQSLPLGCVLPDSAFRNDGQLTKRDVRAITLARLAPRAGELLWDVGAGSGSIGIEWMRAHCRCRAIAIEADAGRQQFIEHNREALGVPTLVLIKGTAPQALQGLEAPDAIFIGGGIIDEGVLDTCWQRLKPGGRLVANAVTMQSEMVLFNWRKRVGGELTRVAISQAQPLGDFDTWRSALPITLLAAVKA